MRRLRCTADELLRCMDERPHSLPPAVHQITRARAHVCAVVLPTQAKLDDASEQWRVRLATEQEACRLIVHERLQAIDLSYREQLDGQRKRLRLLQTHLAAQRAEMGGLKTLNAQLLNEIDPLLLSTARGIVWPRSAPLQQTPPPPTSGGGSGGGSGSGSCGIGGSKEVATATAALAYAQTEAVATRVALRPASRPSSRPASAAATPRPPATDGTASSARPSPRARPASARAATARAPLQPGPVGYNHFMQVRRQAPHLYNTLENVLVQREQRPASAGGSIPTAPTGPILPWKVDHAAQYHREGKPAATAAVALIGSPWSHAGGGAAVCEQ